MGNLRRIHASGGVELSARAQRALARENFLNFAKSLVDFFHFLQLDRARMHRLIDYTGAREALAEGRAAGRGVIAISAHLGNWEILSQACVANGIPMLSVAKQIGSTELTARRSRLRSTIGQQLVPAEGALRPLLRALRDGVSVGLLIDQHTDIWDGGAWVTLFGVPAGISMAPAALSRKTKTPIIFAWSRPLKDGRYRIEHGQVFLPDPQIGDAERAQQLASAFEHVIRRHPSLWCLNYRRWRCIRPGDDPARYPFYARLSKQNAVSAVTS